MPRALACATACLLLASCVRAEGVRTSVDRPASFTDEEASLITAAGPDAPMTLVTNEGGEGDAILRGKSLPVHPADPLLGHLESRMRATLAGAQGVGIAAPQVGIGRRVILVQRKDMEPEQPVLLYLNPRITETSDARLLDWEGCLSIPAGFGKVYRAASIVVEHASAGGDVVSEYVSGYTARIFQHEIDHLDGVLFIDVKEPGELVPKDEYREMKAREKEQDAQG